MGRWMAVVVALGLALSGCGSASSEGGEVYEAPCDQTLTDTGAGDKRDTFFGVVKVEGLKEADAPAVAAWACDFTGTGAPSTERTCSGADTSACTGFIPPRDGCESAEAIVTDGQVTVRCGSAIRSGSSASTRRAGRVLVRVQ